MNDHESTTYKVLKDFTKMLKIRRKEPLFHPNCGQIVLNVSKNVFALIRFNNEKNIICVTNVTNANVIISINRINLPYWSETWKDILTGKIHTSISGYLKLDVKPYEIIWLKNS
jgi:sucrose phosphorylase